MNKTEIVLTVRLILQKALASDWKCVLKMLQELDHKISKGEQ